jgi:hypothetical protein
VGKKYINSNENSMTKNELSPSETVKKFMSLVEQNKVDPAMDLFIKDEVITPENTKVTNDKPPKFNWAKSLNERNLVLGNVLSEVIKEDHASVNVELYVKDMPSIVNASEFKLIKENNNWRIFSIKLNKD